MHDKKPNRGWIWFFLVMIVMAVAAAAITWTRQHSAATHARSNWRPRKNSGRREGRPITILWIEKRISSANSDAEQPPEIIESKIRSGKVLSATLDGRPMETATLAETTTCRPGSASWTTF